MVKMVWLCMMQPFFINSCDVDITIILLTNRYDIDVIKQSLCQDSTGAIMAYWHEYNYQSH